MNNVESHINIQQRRPFPWRRDARARTRRLISFFLSKPVKFAAQPNRKPVKFAAKQLQLYMQHAVAYARTNSSASSFAHYLHLSFFTAVTRTRRSVSLFLRDKLLDMEIRYCIVSCCIHMCIYMVNWLLYWCFNKTSCWTYGDFGNKVV